MAASKHFVANYILELFLQGQKNHLHGTSVEVVMQNFSTMASPNCRSFVAVSNWDHVP